jgi:hypothetical protein
MKYVLMFAGNMDDQKTWEKMPEATRDAAYGQVMQWFEEHSKAGRITGGAELQGPSSSTTVRFNTGKAVVTDGPFIEAKEIVGGFAIVDVKDLDEALAMAKTWPGGGPGRIVEVRPVIEHPNGS